VEARWVGGTKIEIVGRDSGGNNKGDGEVKGVSLGKGSVERAEGWVEEEEGGGEWALGKVSEELAYK